MPKSKNLEQKGETSTGQNLRWTPEMDTMLLEALLEEAHKGNRPNGTWSTQAYINVVSNLRPTIGPHIRKDHIKNRMRTLKDHFNECYDLFRNWSGVSWNPMTQMFDAEPEVWNEILQEKPEAKKWKRTPIQNYDKLFELWGKDRATGSYAESAKDKLKRWEKENIDLNDCLEGMMSDSELQWGHDTPNSVGNMDTCSLDYGHSNQSQGTSSSRGIKRKAATIDLLEREYDKVSLGINSLTNIMREGNQIAERHVAIAERQIQVAEKSLIILEQSKPRYYTEGDVWKELEDIGVIPEFRLQCYRFLCENDSAKKEFFGVPSELRMEFLLQMMRDGGKI